MPIRVPKTGRTRIIKPEAWAEAAIEATAESKIVPIPKSAATESATAPTTAAHGSRATAPTALRALTRCPGSTHHALSRGVGSDCDQRRGDNGRANRVDEFRHCVSPQGLGAIRARLICMMGQKIFQSVFLQTSPEQ
jgi:hypothetical protein